jgi:hypothetical protein
VFNYGAVFCGKFRLAAVRAPIISDFLGSATVPVAAVGVPLAESIMQNRLAVPGKVIKAQTNPLSFQLSGGEI